MWFRWHFVIIFIFYIFKFIFYCYKHFVFSPFSQRLVPELPVVSLADNVKKHLSWWKFLFVSFDILFPGYSTDVSYKNFHLNCCCFNSTTNCNFIIQRKFQCTFIVYFKRKTNIFSYKVERNHLSYKWKVYIVI